MERFSDRTHQDSGIARRRFVQATAALGVPSLAGCIGDGGDTGDGAGSGSITIGYQPFYAQAWSAVVAKHAGLVEKHTPDGLEVEWQSALQGAVIGTRMHGGKNHVGYAGDMPTITTIAGGQREGVQSVSAVGLAGFSQGQQCNLAVVPSESDVENVEDLAGKSAALTTGTCTHRFFLRVLEEEGIDVEVQDSGINTVLSNIRKGTVPVGFGWEPNMAKAVIGEGEGEYLFTGADYDAVDCAGLLMADDLLENRPEVARGVAKAELEAKHVMATDEERTLDLVSREQGLSGYSREVLRSCLYEPVPVNPDVPRLEFVTDYREEPAAEELLKRKGPAFLRNQGAIDREVTDAMFRPTVLDDAAEELAGEVDWEPLGGRGAGNASASDGATGGAGNATTRGLNDG